MSEIIPSSDVLEAIQFILKANRQFSQFEFKDNEAPVEIFLNAISTAKSSEDDLIRIEQELQKDLEFTRKKRDHEIQRQKYYFEALSKLISLEDFHKIYERAVKAK